MSGFINRISVNKEAEKCARLFVFFIIKNMSWCEKTYGSVNGLGFLYFMMILIVGLVRIINKVHDRWSLKVW